MPSKFIRARNSNGVIQRVPRRWLEDGSPFAGDFTLTPSVKQAEERSSDPDETWTLRQLRDHAEQAHVDLAGATTKADVLSAIHERASADNSQEG